MRDDADDHLGALAPRACLRIAAALLALVALGVGCSGEDGGGGADGGEDPAAITARRAALESIGDRVILATYEAFVAAARDLEAATAALVADPSAAQREAAQAAWGEAIDVWQRAELFIVGPAGVMGEVAGGEDLRDEVYSWPLANACRVDQELVEEAFTDAAAFAESEAVNVRGLDALEYLLFYEGADNACAPNSTINSSGQWAALDAAELTRRRAAYAHALALDLVARAEALQAAWAPDAGDFRAQLVGAGEAGSVYATTQEALNALSDALFYLDKETKDMKLAQPLGLSECSAARCPEALESRHARRSRQHVLNNLRGFEQVFLGGPPEVSDAAGFDDLLRGVGAGALADRMRDDIAAAIAAVEAIDAPLVEALDAQPAAVQAAYDALKVVTDQLKTEFVSVLDLELPQRAEGDND